MQAQSPRQVVRLELNQAQREQVKYAIGRDSDALELTVEELEERIVPRIMSNHNETLLVDRGV